MFGVGIVSVGRYCGCDLCAESIPCRYTYKQTIAVNKDGDIGIAMLFRNQYKRSHAMKSRLWVIHLQVIVVLSHVAYTCLSLAKLLLEIPYGETVSYGELAARCALRAGAGGGSARAVGGEVGRNPISIIVPCHRVVGAWGALTGYAGGLRRKAALLEIEAGGTKKAAAD